MKTLYTFLVFIFILATVQAQEIEATLGGSTSSHGFSVKDDGANTLFRVRGDGNIGIGTTAPQNKLDVEGGAVVGASYSGTNTAPTNGLLVEGDVGIGTTTPNANLHIFQNNGNAVLQIEAQGGDQDPVVQFTGNGPLEYWTVGFDDSDGDKFKIGRGATLGTDDKLTIQEDGNVGIGTTSPTAKLHIGGTSGVDGIKFPDGTLQTTAATGGSGLWSASGSYIYYNSGNVGIGTASPSANLHIFQNNGNAVLQIEAQGGDQDPVVQFSGNTGPEYWTVGFDDSDGDKFKIGRGPILGTDDKLTIQEDGNVGIGTTAPTATLDVNKFHRLQSTAFTN